MNGSLSLALITYREGIRNRAVLGVGLFALFVFGLNVTVAGFFMRDIGKVTVDMNLGALSFAGLMLILFIGTNLMAKDIDKRTIHLVLSKPISRYGYIWGKYFGLLFFLAISLGFLFILSLLTIFLLQNIYSDYFQGFSWLFFCLAGFGIFIKTAIVAAFVVFFSAVCSSSFVTLVFTMCSYVIGITIEEVIFYLKSSFASQDLSISESLLKFIFFVSNILPNLSVFDFRLNAAYGLPISWERFAFSHLYALVYIVVLLQAASLIFSRREFN